MQPEHLEFSLSSLYNLFCKKYYWAPPQILQLYSEVKMIEFKTHIDGFINYCRYHKKLSDKTISAYCIDLIQFRCFTSELSKQSLWNYIEHLNKSYKPKTVKRKWQRSKRLLTICLFGILSIAIRLIKLKHQSKNLLYCQKPFLWIRLARFSVLHIRK